MKNYSAYLRSPKWYRIRKKVLKRDSYQCIGCGASRKLQVHHKNYKNIGKEKLDDLITLCARCHFIFHKKAEIIPNRKKKTKWLTAPNSDVYHRVKGVVTRDLGYTQMKYAESVCGYVEKADLVVKSRPTNKRICKMCRRRYKE